MGTNLKNWGYKNALKQFHGPRRVPAQFNQIIVDKGLYTIFGLTTASDRIRLDGVISSGYLDGYFHSRFWGTWPHLRDFLEEVARGGSRVGWGIDPLCWLCPQFWALGFMMRYTVGISTPTGSKAESAYRWPTCSGRFTHIRDHPSAVSRAQDREFAGQRRTFYHSATQPT